MFGHLRTAAACAAVAGMLALSAATAAGATNSPAHRSGLQQELEAFVHAQGGPPGVIVTFERRGATSVYRAGFADIATRQPPRVRDAMRIASVAKAFSGAVALSLVARGTLSLDDTIAHRLPTLPAAWGAVTLRELLQHTSGLPDYSGTPAFREDLASGPAPCFRARRPVVLRGRGAAAVRPGHAVSVLQLRQHRCRPHGPGGDRPQLRAAAERPGVPAHRAAQDQPSHGYEMPIPTSTATGT